MWEKEREREAPREEDGEGERIGISTGNRAIPWK